jgi:hypothetical protein
VLATLSERERRWVIDEISDETRRVIEPYTETILRAVLRLLPPLTPAAAVTAEDDRAAIRALSRNHPPRRIGDGCYLVGGFAIVTSDPLDGEQNP